MGERVRVGGGGKTMSCYVVPGVVCVGGPESDVGGRTLPESITQYRCVYLVLSRVRQEKRRTYFPIPMGDFRG